MIERQLNAYLLEKYGDQLESTSAEHLYDALIQITNEQIRELPKISGTKKLYYVSAEFLLGKMLASNLVNLHLIEDVQSLLSRSNIRLEDVLALEVEPSLGNGGLGRLAACFIDSMAALNLPGDGIGLFYHFGLFKQVFEDLKQTEIPDQWLNGNVWFRKTEDRFPVKLGTKEVTAVKYEMDVVGYHKSKNTLHLFDLEGVDETLIDTGIQFDQTKIEKNLTLFLYPDDATEEGRLLRIYQQYFMVSSGAQLILYEYAKTGFPLKELADHIMIQINDTHPTMIIPELIFRLEHLGLAQEEAIDLVIKSCAYTNHTILAEALEKWSLKQLEQVIPHLVPIIRVLDQRVKQQYSDSSVYIIDDQDVVHMAHIDIHFSSSVNGVAKLHTEILEDTELHHFYTIYPEKFSNKTNGITFRRWISSANPELYQLIQETVQRDINIDYQALSYLMAYQDNDRFKDRLVQIKTRKRNQFMAHIKRTQGIDLPKDAIVITQIKRMHEYKRQQMNALSIIHLYQQIKQGHLPQRPLVFVFGAKAAPAYVSAKDIIHLLLVLSKVIENDAEVSPYLRIVFIENYNVTEAEIVIPATDISEQISLASKEASGTGNMKFMLNGALTLGTNDGANVEIRELVGDDNIFMFGESSEQIIDHYLKKDYHPEDYYQRPLVKSCVDFITGEQALAYGDKTMLSRLKEDLIHKDWFMALLDLENYIQVKQEMINAFENRPKWVKAMIVNIAKSGFFSSDRSIEDYNRDIWKLK